MPRPVATEKTELSDEQQWFLTALDMKFRQQETVIRALLESHQHFPATPFYDALTAGDAGGALNGSPPAAADEAPPSPQSDGFVSANHTQDSAESQDLQATESQELQRRATKKTKSLGKTTMSEMQTEEVPALKKFVKGPLDGYLGIVVLVNLGMMAAVAQITGHEADVSLGLSPPEVVTAAPAFDIIEGIFFAVYLLDVVVRMIVLRKEWYFDEVEGIMYMNMFDAILVLVHGFELMLLPVFFSGDSEQRASTVRVIKLLRIVRTLRIIKTVALFRQLRLLVTTCVASIGALFWSMVMLFLIKLGFALIICQALQSYILDESNDMDTRLEMNWLYGSFLKALYTMFEVTHAGSWPTRVRPVVDKVSPWYCIPFLGYITLVVFAVIRVVTALFLKETLASAANDADMQIEENRRTAKNYQEKLEDLFRAVDEDGNDWLSAEEFIRALSLPSVQRYLAILDLKVSDCRPLFEILDDGDGKITIAEFCQGLNQIKGHARALDMVVLQRESAKLLKECQDIRKELKALLPALVGLTRKSGSKTFGGR
ncbi:Sodium channel protein type 10 subunit alpha [Symbiodinium microadriaticum]|uniref:Sodium channel protein type 10 subunit alpha n=1 Tax=Symbiodinium microadriaticum TaxID=2951 RepID=A0A1Q9E652_SYMMI|nr:Sodium channel protein type 10 subunit alpha [Symbiodinium microadriaticum]CAE7896910.1 Scn10a [Symbiodinium microadriaticum]CAE7933519.1 Scn10a [Symbiodinium sp. KB8]